MKKAKGKERRKAQRLGIPLRVEYHLSVRRKTLIEKVFTKDVSGSGVRLLLKEPLRPKAKLKTLIYFPNDAQPITSISEVVWCKRQKNIRKPSFIVGIRHLKIMQKDRERFIFLFCETMINYFMLPTKTAAYE